MTRHTRPLAIVAVVFVIAVIAAIAVAGSGSFALTEEVTATVLDKERVCSGNSDGGIDCNYLIFTDTETFKVADSLIIGRWNSSDVYGRIRRDRTYKFVVYGWRVGWASEYRNIKDFEEVPQ